MIIPEEYKGREPTFLKHQVLTRYIVDWAHKRGSRSRFGRTRLWFVDCFAGPWASNDEEFGDTSIAIGLGALQKAADTWKSRGSVVELGAVFVEKDRDAYEKLKRLLSGRFAEINTHPLHGEFGEKIEEIDRLVGEDSAFLFVDPKGWKGAAMKFIAPLAEKRDRDVLINVMFNFIRRFKDAPQQFLREQMEDFFGLGQREIPNGLGEDELFELYRRQVREKCRVEYAADLAIRRPGHDRTWFRLVLGARHPKAIELFRSVEKKVCGERAAEVTDEVKHRDDRQPDLFKHAPEVDGHYSRLREEGIASANDRVLRLLSDGPRRYDEVWPELLQELHITKSDANKIVRRLAKEDRLVLRGIFQGKRTPRDDTVLELQHRQAKEKPSS
jgi:three-Cys-motif partner protein